MAEIKPDYGTGGSGLTPSSGNDRHPPLATVLRDIATDLAALAPEPGWSNSISVTSHVATINAKVLVVAVHATAGSSAGPKQQISSGTPSAGQVKVEYGATTTTLTFNTTDAITACVISRIPYPTIGTTAP
jgi:hypothetical protein